jgi:hypothetical protein
LRSTLVALAFGVLCAASSEGFGASFIWTTGDFLPGVTAPSPLEDMLLIAPGDTDNKRFFGSSFVNSGHVQWLGGSIQSPNSIQGANGATVSNMGEWDALGDDSLTGGGSPLPMFTNTGTLRKSGGTGTTTIGNWIFANDAGILDARVGTLAFNGGRTTFKDGSKFQGAGSVSITADAAFNGNIFSDNLALSAGVFTGTNARLAGGATKSAGQIVWSAGNLTGTWEIAAGSTLMASSAGTKQQTGGAIVNLGTVLWNAATGLQGGNNAVFANRGLFEAQVDTRIATFNTASRNTFMNHASGILRAADGVTLTVDGAALVSDGGELNAGAGASIIYQGGFARFNDGTRFTGAGSHVFKSDARFVGAFQTGNVAFSGGTQSGGDDASAGSKAILQGRLTWTAGIIQGAWEIQPGSVLEAVGATSKQHLGGSIVNDGSVFWNSGAALQGGNGAAFVNNGLFEVGTSSSLTFQGSGNRNTFTNAASGVVRAAKGATLTFNGVALTANGGEFEAGAGSAIEYASGFAQFNDGTRFTGAGMQTVSNDARFVGAFRAENLAFVPGGVRFGGDGNVGSKAIVQGKLEWRGAELQGAWEIAPGGTLTATGAGVKTQRGGSILNQGTVRWSSDESLQTANGARFTNDGVFDVSTDADLAQAAGMPGTFVNNGRFVKSGGSGETSLRDVNFSSSGVIDVRSGTIVLPNNFQNTGVLTGTGTFALAGMLNNDGHVAPGESPGTLTIDGHFVQNDDGVLDIEVNSASLYDRLVVKGLVMLDGTLALHCFADCRMAVGETIKIIEASGPLDGAFDAVTFTGFGAGAAVLPTLDDGFVLLRVTGALAPVPEPETYALMLCGIGLIVCRVGRKRRCAPVAR